MTNIETISSPQVIAASKLEKSPLNARRTMVKGGTEELKASILSHGLMQNLVVTDASDGLFHVIAGGRRLEAIHSLQAEGKLPQDFAVPCQVVTDESALEMSLAENVVRLAMHPADQFEAFAELINKGHTAAEVATRFGIEESLVHKRMKLARIAPELFEEYRNDEMTLECLMAFAVTDDHDRQLKVYQFLQDWQKEDPGAIRDALTEKMIEASSKLARFVGLEAYTAAGGSTHADLFGEDIYLEQPDLLHALAEQKLDAIRQELEAEGWGWIEINPERDYSLISSCKRLRPQLVNAPSELLDLKARLDAELEEIEQMLEETESDESFDRQQELQDQLDEVEEKLAAFIGFDSDQKRLAGCFVSIGQDGTPFFDKGLVKPEHRKELTRFMGEDDDTRPEKVKPKPPLSASLCCDLAAARLEAAQVELAKHPAVTFDLLVFQVASLMLGDSDSVDEGADVRFQIPRQDRSDDEEPTIAGDAFASIANALPVEWLQPTSEVARFEAFRSLPDAAKHELLAYCMARTLKPKLASTAEEDVTAYDVALSLTSGNVADYWRPTSENFLGRITREQLLAVGREVLGEAWAHSRAGDKKASLVGQLHRAFSDPEKPGRTPEQIERLKDWLPVGMSFEIAPSQTANTQEAA
ncbi:ParB N-terminal domain-containing protein [Planctomicrobium sp. SH668]|uniref:ParB/RepB/Spo0J family partition protein n=1 Tax=Planctomicrobium sp. SH668 TaxID=3448126 RepID=UPI003F5C330E